MQHLYEIHCHTSESSPCARENAFAVVKAYKDLGYEGIVITDHLVVGGSHTEPWEQKIAAQQAGYYAALDAAKELGLKVLYGAELTVYPYRGNDFLIYGLDAKWFRENDLNELSLQQALAKARAEGGFVSHAHPFREAGYIAAITLLPRYVDAVEYNANRTQFENERALEYAKAYNLPVTAGTDNHLAHRQKRFFGMRFNKSVTNEAELALLLYDREFELKTE